VILAYILLQILTFSLLFGYTHSLLTLHLLKEVVSLWNLYDKGNTSYTVTIRELFARIWHSKYQCIHITSGVSWPTDVWNHLSFWCFNSSFKYGCNRGMAFTVGALSWHTNYLD